MIQELSELAPWLLAGCCAVAAGFAGVAATRSPSSRVRADAHEAIEIAEGLSAEWRRVRAQLIAEAEGLRDLDQRITRKKQSVAAREVREREQAAAQEGANGSDPRAAVRARLRQRGML